MNTGVNDLLVFPGMGNDPGSFHIPRLLRELEARFNINSRYVGPDALNPYSNRRPLRGAKILINWLDTLYFASISRRMATAVSIAPSLVRSTISGAIALRIMDRLNRLQQNGNRLIFFYHDIGTFSRIPLIQSIDARCRSEIHRIADATVFASNSARQAVEANSKFTTRSFISCLGDYRQAHGPHKEKQYVRASLGIPMSATVLIALGTLRTNRRLAHLLGAIREGTDLFLICAGRGNRDFREKNILSKAGYLSNSEIADLLGCSDYLLHTGTGYLTSASVRTGLSYGLPVIAEPFGATIDLCGPALVKLEQDCVPSEFFRSLPRLRSFEHEELIQRAKIQDQKFTWQSAAEGLLEAFRASESRDLD